MNTLLTINSIKKKKYNNIYYYRIEDIKTIIPSYFKGCRSTRNIITKKSIPPNHYLFYYVKDRNLVPSTITYRRSKLLLTIEWVQNNIPAFKQNYHIQTPKNIHVPKILNTKEDITPNNNIIIEEDAPPLLELDDEQKFKDNEGNVYEVEVRGERHYEKIYFNVNDVAKYLQMDNLRNSVLKKNRSYELIEHYKYFKCFNSRDIVPTNKLYFTYS